MDIMDIQAVESKLSDVTVTPIPRSQVQNFYNYQQREQREQQPQIQISAIHHTPRERHHTQQHHHHGTTNSHRDADAVRGQHSTNARDLYTTHSKRERDYHQQLSQVAAAVAGGSTSNAAVAAAALQYTQQLQAQLALLQQQANTTASPSITLTPANPRTTIPSTLQAQLSMTAIPNTNHHNINQSNNRNNHHHHSTSITATNGGGGASSTTPSSTPSQLKYPQSSSPLELQAFINSSQSTNMSSPITPSASTISSNNGQNNGLTKYAQLLAVIEEMGRDIRPTYTGSRSSTERLKRGIVHARILVRECLQETERSARQ